MNKFSGISKLFLVGIFVVFFLFIHLNLMFESSWYKDLLKYYDLMSLSLEGVVSLDVNLYLYVVLRPSLNPTWLKKLTWKHAFCSSPLGKKIQLFFLSFVFHLF